MYVLLAQRPQAFYDLLERNTIYTIESLDTMHYQPFFPINQLENVGPLWKYRVHKKIVILIQKLLVEISHMLGLELRAVVPGHFLKHDLLVWNVVPLIEVLKKLGIVKSFLEVAPSYPDEPQGHIIRVVIHGRGGLGYKGSGRDIFDKSKAAWAGVGEAIERWALSNYYPLQNELIDSSFKNLRQKKLNIFSIVGFSDILRKKGHPEYNLLFDEMAIFRWVKAYSLIDNEVIYVPLQLVSFRRCYEISGIYGKRDEKTESLLAPIISSGAATGQTLERALLNGLLEVIERDAFMIHWFNTIVLDRINIHTIPDERVHALSVIAERYNLEVHLVYLKTDVPVHTVLCLVIDKTGIGPAVYLDAKSGFQLSEVVYAILSESLAIRQGVRRFMDTNSPSFQFKNYASLGHKERMLFWFQKERIKNVLFWTTGNIKEYSDFPNYAVSVKNTAEELTTLLAFFKKQRYQVLYKEILEESIKKKLSGITTVMVKVPQFQPLYLDESLPAFADSRIKEVPRKIGIMPRASLNTFPHPFV